MSTTDNVTYTITMTFTAGAAKFRQDDAWTINWGATAFPVGTATQNGPNIPVPAGTYTVTFNRLTGAYAFEGSALFPSVGMLGSALGDDFAGPDTNMTTADGTTYTLSGFTFLAGEAKFRQDDAWTVNWGDTAFPTGTALQGGPNIPVPAGTYSVTFNRTTGNYNFGYVSIGILGSAIDPVTGWDADIDLTTTDGISYTLHALTLIDGEVKFRQDNSWDKNWGGDGFPTGTGLEGGINIVATAGTYDVTFDRNTLAYTFVPSLGVNRNDRIAMTVSPNPASGNWNLRVSAPIQLVQLFDMTGKKVMEVRPASADLTLDGSALAPGMYLARVSTAGATANVKLIRQ